MAHIMRFVTPNLGVSESELASVIGSPALDAPIFDKGTRMVCPGSDRRNGSLAIRGAGVAIVRIAIIACLAAFA